MLFLGAVGGMGRVELRAASAWDSGTRRWVSRNPPFHGHVQRLGSSCGGINIIPVSLQKVVFHAVGPLSRDPA